MQAIMSAVRKFREETDGLFAFIVLPMFLIFGFLFLMTVVPSPVMAIAIEFVLLVVPLLLGLVLGD